MTPFATKQFPWIGKNGDYICEIDEYTLRVEQMDKARWWWRVYFRGEPLPEYTNENASNKFQAIGRAEGLYMGHFIFTSHV